LPRRQQGKLNENTPRPVSDYFDSFKRESEPMILLKSILAGVAALFTAALATYGVSVVAPHILELMPSREGRIDAFFFPLWQFVVVALLISSGGFYWGFRRAMGHRQKVS
jgi:hypothetical protein